jgi:hypothetical protein
MEDVKTFKTKTGYCHILADRIVLSRDGIIGNVSKIVVGNTMSKILIAYAIIAVIFIYLGIENLKKGGYTVAVFSLFIGLYLIYGIISSWNNSATPVIDRNTIKKVVFKKGIKGITRSRFEITFLQENKTKKRLIMLPGSFAGNEQDLNNAFKIMKEEGLLS